MVKNRFCLRTICIALVLSVLLATTCFASGEIFGKIGYTDETLKSFAKDSVILRINNNVFLYDNVDREFSINTEVHPYLDGGEIKTPVGEILSAFGYEVNQEGEKMVASKDGKQVVFSSGTEGTKAFMHHSYLYASVKDIAEAIGMKYFDNGVIAIISPNLDPSKVTVPVADDLAIALNYKWDNIWLGALGYVTQVVTHPLNKDLVYCVTDVGGVYRFNHETEKWIQLMSSTPVEYVGANAGRWMTLDPTDDNIIYLATGNGSKESDPGGIFKSTDKGVTWKRLDLAPTCGQMASNDIRFGGSTVILDPNNTNILYAATMHEGLWRSEDAGETWVQMPALPEAVKDLSPLFVYTDGIEKMPDGRSKEIYMSFFTGGLYKSEDAGASFTKVQGSPVSPMRMTYSDGGHWVSAYGKSDRTMIGGFFRLEDGKWIDRSPYKYGYPLSVSAIMVDKDDKDTLYVCGAPFADGGLFRSVDAGKTWEQLGKWNIIAEIVQDPLNPDALWAAYAGGVYYIDGIHGKKVNCVKREYGIEVLVCEKGICMPDPNGPMFLSGFMDHGYRAQEEIYELAPDSLPEVNTLAGVDFCEEDNSFVVRAGLHSTPPKSTGSITISNDYGRNFVKMPWDETLGLCDVAVGATLQENGYPIIVAMSTGNYKTQGGGRGIYRSLDGGNTWEICEDVVINRKQTSYYQVRILESDRVDGYTFYYMNASGIYRTRDGGKTWRMIKQFPKNPSHDIAIIRAIPGVEGGVWHSSSDRSISVSYDFGDTWKTLDTIELFDARCFGFGIGKPGSKLPAAYVPGYVNGEYGIWLSDDLGENWRKISIEGEKILSKHLDVAGDRRVYGRCFVSTGGRGVIAGWPVDHDDVEPVITMETQSSTEAGTVDYAVNEKEFIIKGSINEPAELRINGEVVAVDGYDKFSHKVSLNVGENKFLVEAKDNAGNFAKTQELMIRYDPSFLMLDFDNGNKVDTKENKIVISGRTTSPATVYANGKAVKTGENNTFTYETAVTKSMNINFYAVGTNGLRSATKIFEVVYDKAAPKYEINHEVLDTEHRYSEIQGKLSEPGSLLINGDEYQINDDLTFSVKVPVEIGANSVRFQARDTAKNATKPINLDILRTQADTSSITAKRLPEGFVYDGKVNGIELPIHCDKLFYGESDNEARFGLYYDDEYLWIITEVKDSIFRVMETSRYKSDAVEYYIDGGNEKTVTYDANDRQYCWVADERFLQGDDFKFYREDGMYSIVTKIKLSAHGIKPVAGTVFGFDLDVIDNDGYSPIGDRDGAIGLHGNDRDWCDASAFSTVTLID